SNRERNCWVPPESACRPPAQVTDPSDSPMTWRVSSIGDPRVDVGIEDVDQDVEAHDQDSEYGEDAHQERIVIGLKRLEEGLTHTRPAVDRLSDDRAAEEQRHLDRDV